MSRPALRIGPVKLGERPCIAVPFGEPPRPDEVARLAAAGMDVAELRADLFPTPEVASVLAALDAFGDVPVLATVRRAEEGGSFRGTEAERLALYRALAPRVEAIDVEIASPIARAGVDAARAAGALALASFHDFAKTPPPDALDEVVSRGRDLGADVVKVATAVTGTADLRALARLLTGRDDVGLVVIGMGPRGVATRVLFPALGSLVTYASGAAATAPGQLPLAELRALLEQLGLRGWPG